MQNCTILYTNQHNFNKLVQDSTKLYTTLQHCTKTLHNVSNGFKTLDKSCSIKLYNIVRNHYTTSQYFTQLINIFIQSCSQLFKTIQNFYTTLRKLLHKLYKLYTILQNYTNNCTKLHNTLQNLTQLYTTPTPLQSFTNFYKTSQTIYKINFTTLYNSTTLYTHI